MIMVQITGVFTQRNTVVIGAGWRQPAFKLIFNLTLLRLVGGNLLGFKMLAQTAQAHHVFADGAGAHVGAFKQVLFKADDIEMLALHFAVQIAAEAAQRRPFVALAGPGRFID